MSDGENIRACKANCYTCAFKYNVGKKQTLYCALKRFPILNPDIGCSRRMTKGDFTNRTLFKEDEIAAAEEANRMNNYI